MCLIVIRDNQIVNELIEYSRKIYDFSQMSYLVISLYFRDIGPVEFMRNAVTFEGGFSVGIRYLYLMLLSFEEIKLLKNQCPDIIAEIFLTILRSIFDLILFLRYKHQE